jgi:hypothetical protein
MDIPLYVTAAVLAGAAFAVLAVPLALVRAAGRATAWITGVGLSLWLGLTLVLASAGAFQASLIVPPIALALAAALPRGT